MFRIIKRAPWIALGAAAVWFGDPTLGPARRRQVRRRVEEITSPDLAIDAHPEAVVESSPIARAS